MLTQTHGSFYIKDDGTGSATVSVNVTIGNTTKQYHLTVTFADAFDFTDTARESQKRGLLTSKQTITLDSDGRVSNIAIYKAQSDIVKGGSITPCRRAERKHSAECRQLLY